MMKLGSYSTVTMVIYIIYLMSRWISICFELWLNIGISPTTALLLENFTGFDLGTSGYEEKGRCLRFEYLQVGYFPKSARANR
ncbi:hypothetical protein Goari_027504 [Gossypium aridum]|uniref:Uncharacterized protein n=1 Tax=Gossypium aridum TaxID=34290 RepID=A0A7J8YVD1_GOSAI|nr:hypothetical protein [Gossypium aridum]